MIGITPALIGMGLASAGSGIAKSVIGSKAAGSAAAKQAAAADQVAELAKSSGQQAIAANNAGTDAAQQTLRGTLAQQTGIYQPFADLAPDAISAIKADTGAGGALSKEFKFDPNAYFNDPSYDFVKAEGLKALERSNAARGALVGGGAMKAALRYGTGVANTFYNQAHDRAIEDFKMNQSQALARLSANAGLLNTGFQGATRIGEATGNIGTNLANLDVGRGRYEGDVGLRTAQMVSDAITGKANAQAAGDIGRANAISGGIGDIAGAVNTGMILGSELNPFLHSTVVRTQKPGKGRNPGGDLNV